MGHQGIIVEHWKRILKTCAKGTKFRVYTHPNGHSSLELRVPKKIVNGEMSSKPNKKYQYSFMDQIFSIIITNRIYNIHSFS